MTQSKWGKTQTNSVKFEVFLNLHWIRSRLVTIHQNAKIWSNSIKTCQQFFSIFVMLCNMQFVGIKPGPWLLENITDIIEN
jgi:hypothetical protein